jgi:hypothetical protein
VHEVPLLQPPLLALDQKQALAGEDEEVLLLVLAVIHARGLPRLEDADVETDLLEARVRALEARVGAEVTVLPDGLLRVQDEPALPLRADPGVGAVVLRLGHHAGDSSITRGRVPPRPSP